MATYNQNAMTLPSGDVVNFEDAYGRVEYIRGTWTAASGTWTGVTTDPVLYDGKKIILFMPYAGSGNATLNLTLSGGGTTGAKNVYFESTTRFTTHKGQYSHLELIYHKALVIGSTTYEGWWYLANRDTTINYQMRNANNVKAYKAATQYQLVGGTANGYIPIVANAVIDTTYPLLTTQSAWAAGGNYNNGFFEYQDQNIRNAIPSLGSSYAGLTAGKMVYLVGSQFIGVSFTVDSTIVTCTPNVEGKYYIPIGIAYSTYQYYFYSQRLVYTYSDGTLAPVGSGGGGGAAGFGGVEMHGVVLSPSGWSSNSQTVSITTAAVATSDFLSIPQVETAAEYTGSGIVLSTVNVDTTNHTAALKFTCTTVPTAQVATTVIVSTSATATQTALDAKVDKVTGKGLSTNDFTTAEKNKLSGIESGAQVNTITGVKGNAESSYRTGNVNLTPANIGAVPTSRTVNGHALSANVTVTASDVGLGNVNNTSDLNKPISTATQTALNAKVNKTDIATTSDLGLVKPDGSTITIEADGTIHSVGGGGGGGGGGESDVSVLYFYNRTVSVATNAEILRITDSAITINTIVLECTFANPSAISGDVSWTSYNGYISFTGTCTSATTANVTLADKTN